MLPISVVILTLNEEKNIERTLNAIQNLSDDILIIDSGSTDNTLNIVHKFNVKIHQIPWLGYAETKNEANKLTLNDWILSLDADEVINIELFESIEKLFKKSIDENTVYKLKRKMMYCGAVLDFGSVSNEYILKLFNKKNARWNKQLVHEDIEFIAPVIIKKLKGFILHHSYYTNEDHKKKKEKYAQIFANQKIKEGIKISPLKKYFNSLFGFIKNYFFRLGFLDGKKGLQFAWIEMQYTFRKYYLSQHNHS